MCLCHTVTFVVFAGSILISIMLGTIARALCVLVMTPLAATNQYLIIMSLRFGRVQSWNRPKRPYGNVVALNCGVGGRWWRSPKMVFCVSCSHLNVHECRQSCDSLSDSSWLVLFRCHRKRYQLQQTTNNLRILTAAIIPWIDKRNARNTCDYHRTHHINHSINANVLFC